MDQPRERVSGDWIVECDKWRGRFLFALGC